MKKSNLLSRVKIYILVLPIAIFGIITVFFAIQSGASGAKLTMLESEIRQLGRENKDLSDELVNSTSLSEISRSTEERGFTTPSEIVYVSRDSEVASLLR